MIRDELNKKKGSRNTKQPANKQTLTTTSPASSCTQRHDFMRRPPPVKYESGGGREKEGQRERQRRSREAVVVVVDVSSDRHRCFKKAKQTTLSRQELSFLLLILFVYSPRGSLKTSPGTSATRSCAGREGALSWFPIEDAAKGQEEQAEEQPLSLSCPSCYPRDLEGTMSMLPGGHRGAVVIRRRNKERAPAEMQKEGENRPWGKQKNEKQKKNDFFSLLHFSTLSRLSTTTTTKKKQEQERRRNISQSRPMAPSSTNAGGPVANALGTVGGLLLSICLMPQLYRIYKTRSTTGETRKVFF